jgi:hypothetical protein
MFYLYHQCQMSHMFLVIWTAYFIENFCKKSTLLYQLFHLLGIDTDPDRHALDELEHWCYEPEVGFCPWYADILILGRLDQIRHRLFHQCAMVHKSFILKCFCKVNGKVDFLSLNFNNVCEGQMGRDWKYKMALSRKCFRRRYC